MTDQGPAERVRDAVTSTPQRRLTWRLGLGVGAAVVVSVPFTALALLVRSQADWLRELDQGVADRLHALVLGDEALTSALVVLQEVTQPWRLYCVTAVVVVVLMARRAYRLATWLAITSGAGWFLGFALKLVVQRSRPSFPDPVELAPGFSFPSGHALNSMVFAGTMVLLLDLVVRRPWRPVVWALGGIFVLAIGLDRVGLGVHYVSDVLAGWAVGLGIVVAGAVAFRTWRRRERGVPDESGRAL